MFLQCSSRGAKLGLTKKLDFISIGGATPGPAGAQAPAENAVPQLVPGLEKLVF